MYMYIFLPATIDPRNGSDALETEASLHETLLWPAYLPSKHDSKHVY